MNRVMASRSRFQQKPKFPKYGKISSVVKKKKKDDMFPMLRYQKAKHILITSGNEVDT